MFFVALLAFIGRAFIHIQVPLRNSTLRISVNGGASRFGLRVRREAVTSYNPKPKRPTFHAESRRLATCEHIGRHWKRRDCWSCFDCAEIDHERYELDRVC